MTVHGCTNASIHHNQFIDNTDVDLVIGNSPTNCQVYSNTITHVSTYGVGGLGVAFNGTAAGLNMYGNSISANQNKLGMGLFAGHHPWVESDMLASLGNITSNYVSGAAVLGVIDGVSSGNFSGNSAGNWWQGARGHNGCNGPFYFMVNTNEMNTSSVQPGYQPWRFHTSGCIPQ